MKNNNWEKLRIGDILKVKSGRDQKAVEYKNGKYQILGTGGEIGRTNTFLYDKPSVLIGRKGTINKPMYKDKPFWTVDTLFYTEIKDGFLPKYVYYLFNTINWLRYNEASGVPSLTSSTIEKIKVKVPDLETQQKIVQILDTWNNAIDAIKTRLVQEDNLMKYLYAALLSGYKTTGKSNEYVDIELGEVANIERGKTLTAKEIVPGDIPVIAGGIDSPYNHNQYTHENVITISASGANAGYVDYRHGKIWASDCNVIYGKEGISDTMYIFSWLVLLQKLIYQLQTGGAQPHVHAKDLAKLKISLPPLEIQQDIVIRLSTQAAKISRLEEYRDNLQNQYRYLLNHLISGDFDLTNIKLEKGKEQQ